MIDREWAWLVFAIGVFIAGIGVLAYVMLDRPKPNICDEYLLGHGWSKNCVTVRETCNAPVYAGKTPIMTTRPCDQTRCSYAKDGRTETCE